MKIALLTLLCVIASNEQDFVSQQKKYPRVRNAYHEKEALLTRRLKEHNLSLDNLNILIMAYKTECVMDIYAKKREDKVYKKITTYKICARSGSLGPKRHQGDLQIPEGFYHINHFNPTSNYHLSLMINYPNHSDKLKSKASHLGGNICIHGNCVTVGCLPMTDDKIKEIYIYAIQARQSGQEKIPVYIFPFKFSDEKNKNYSETYRAYPNILDFWKNLETGYNLFIKDLKELNISVDKLGNYQFSK